MSYDIWLVVDVGGIELATVWDPGWNYTSNCSPMWRAAGADLASFDGLQARDCVEVLRSAIEIMDVNPARFEAMNPENGWGSYATVVPALIELLNAFEAHPRATVRVSR